MTIYVKTSVVPAVRNKCSVLPLRSGNETNAYISGHASSALYYTHTPSRGHVTHPLGSGQTATYKRTIAGSRSKKGASTLESEYKNAALSHVKHLYIFSFTTFTEGVLAISHSDFMPNRNK